MDLATDTAHWSATTGGSSCNPCEPNSSSNLTFDGSSGGGTVTVAIGGGTLTVATLTMGAFTGTLDFAANDNNVTVGAGGVSISGTGARTLNMGDGTWTISALAPWVAGTVTNLTFNANASTLLFSNTTSSLKTVTLGTSLTYNIVTFAAQTSRGGFFIQTGTTPTIGTWNILAPNYVSAGQSMVIAVTNAMTATGTRTSPIGFGPASETTGTWTISSANTFTCDWCSFRLLTFTGGGSTAITSSFDLGINTGLGTISPPAAAGGGGGGIIGG
jgi:hypothetical protein